MERNLYAPPAAPVADPVEAPEDRGRRPIEVTWAVRLLWASLAVGVVGQLWQYLLRLPFGYLIILLVALAIRCVISVWVLYRIANGRNWARLVLLAILLLGLAYIGYNWRVYAAIFNGTLNEALVSTITKTILDIGATGLLFTPAANRWFRPSRTAADVARA
jgi:hypothetical protein